MNNDRRAQLWSRVVAIADGSPVTVEHVCAAAISATGVDSAAVAVMLSATPRETLYASDGLAAELEELTLTLGEGPGVDAAAGPVIIGELNDASCETRWPMFAPAAVRAGVHAMFALPLRVGAVLVGVLDLYRGRPGDLDRGQLADAFLLADTLCALLLDDPSNGSRRSSEGSPERASGHNPEVHQATGMIIVQLGVTAAVALIRLRAYAYANDQHLGDVAADVVARRLRFSDDAFGGDHDER